MNGFRFFRKNVLVIFAFSFFTVFSFSCGGGGGGAPMNPGGDIGNIQHRVTLTQPSSGGTISATVNGENVVIPPEGKSFSEGTVLTFTATPDANYMVASWRGGATVDENNPNVATLTVGGDVTVSASIIPRSFVEVVTPADAFTTTVATGTLPSSENPIVDGYAYWEGVFYKDRNVKLSSFYIDKTEVTYNEWREVYNWAIENGYVFASAGKAGSDGFTTTVGEPLPEDETNGTHPVTTVSWRDCVVWCNAYTEKFMGEEHCVYRKDSDTGTILKDATATDDVDAAFAVMNKRGFRLPTEAEWEFAARYEKGEIDNDDSTAVEYSDGLWLTKLNFASGASAYYYDAAETSNVAWYGSNSTHIVGEKTSNKLGLFDMSGNVYEWCFDWYKSNATASDSDYMEPGTTVVVDPLGADSASRRVYRGGCWYSSEAKNCSVGFRRYDSPGTSSGYMGFRLACRP